MVVSMLTKRQILILKEFKDNMNRHLPSSYFVNKMNVSHRTVQSDIKSLKDELKNLEYLEIESITSKGSKLIVYDRELFTEFMDSLTTENEQIDLSYQSGRINKLLLILLKQLPKLSLQYLADAVYVSKSTILKDLVEVNRVLKKYHLNLMKKNNYEIWVDGQEKDKRMCLLDKDLYFTGSFDQERLKVGDEQRIHTIKAILVKALVQYRYKISDVELQNLIVVINITVKRIADGFYLADSINQMINEDFIKEKSIAQQVFDEISKIYHIKVKPVEVNYLSVYLNSKGDHENQSFISKEINDFIYDAVR